MLRITIALTIGVFAIVPADAQQVQLHARNGVAALSGEGLLEVGDTKVVFDAERMSLKLLGGRAFMKGYGQVHVQSRTLEFKAEKTEFELTPEQISFRVGDEATVILTFTSRTAVAMSIEGAATIKTDSMSYHSSHERIEVRDGQLIVGKLKNAAGV